LVREKKKGRERGERGQGKERKNMTLRTSLKADTTKDESTLNDLGKGGRLEKRKRNVKGYSSTSRGSSSIV